jgi:hypothetical protein
MPEEQEIKLVEHHTHYEEIHGYDKTEWITASEHVKLHNRLRELGKCNIPVDELTKIASKAHQRTDKRILYLNKYHKEYSQNYERIQFSESIGVNVQLNELIRYNTKTGNIIYLSSFRGRHGVKLSIIEVN